MYHQQSQSQRNTFSQRKRRYGWVLAARGAHSHDQRTAPGSSHTAAQASSSCITEAGRPHQPSKWKHMWLSSQATLSPKQPWDEGYLEPVLTRHVMRQTASE